jgi:lysyl endopeptidase
LLRRNRASGDVTVNGRTYWSPQVNGDTLTFEIQLPAQVQVEQLDIAIGQLSHLF